MSQRREIEEEAIQNTMKYFGENTNTKLKEVARLFNCSYFRLLARSHGRRPSGSRGGHNKKLSEPEDQALRDYLLILYYEGTPANVNELQKAANRLLYFKGEGEEVSARWANRWLIRNKIFWKQLKAKPIAAKRREAHLKEDLEFHFADFTRCIGKYGIQTEDVYNFDETGFQIGVVSGGKFLVPDDCQAAYVSDPDNRELVTVVVTIGATARSVPPMIIFKGAHHLRKYFDNDMDKDILWARSESGFSNDKLGFQYLKYFDRYTKKNSVGSYRLLIFDGHGSHLTEEFVDYCWHNKIRPFLLPPHLTHVLQPLDIGIFSTLKHNFKKAVRWEVFLGATEIEKADFFRFFQSFYSQSVTPKHAVSAFRKTGLAPLDSSYAFEKLKIFGENIQDDDLAINLDADTNGDVIVPSTPPPRRHIFEYDWNGWPTPIDMPSRKEGYDYVQRRLELALEGEPITPSVRRVTEKLEIGAQRSMLKGALATQHIQDLNLASQARKKSKNGRKILQKYGEIYGRHALRQIEDNRRDELNVVNMRDARLSKPWKIKYKSVMKELRQNLLN